MKINISYLLGLAFVMLFASCEKDISPAQTTNDLLQGEWEVTSWVSDREQFLGLYFINAEMEFQSHCENAGFVEFRFNLISYGLDQQVLNYVVEEDGEELILQEEGNNYEIDFDDDELEMESEDGTIQIKLERD